jgi:DNA-binding response OmpR family regulator/signal transduction histidine kinase
MKESRDRSPRIETVESHVSSLCAAILRINASLDLGTVLREIVDSARALTGARYGLIVTVDTDGRPRDFVAAGLAPDVPAKMTEWSDGPRLFEHFRDLREPLRVADLPSYARERGFSPELMVVSAMQCTPMRHRGSHVGNFFLGDKEDGSEFTGADEEILVLFASQAATAIVNARAHEAERRARADLETLVETSPMGVVVFDGATAEPVSINREARRIVEPLRQPDKPLEEMLDEIICRRGDGREVALSELPMALQSSSAETVRAEEMTLSVPDRRSVTTLVNATPTRSADGAVESMVVTLQDLAPLEELERQRAEFLGIVSHELRTPLISIKGSATTVLDASRAPEAAEAIQFFRVVNEQADHMHDLIGELLDHGRIVTGTLSVSPEPAEVAGLVELARSAFLAGAANRAITVDLPEDLPPVMADRPRMVQVLNNLLANAARHSPESAPIEVRARRDGVHVAVSVTDGGPGLPANQLRSLFNKHAHTVEEGSVRPGRSGLGLAICKGLVEAHGGRIWAESAGAERGTRFTFTAPVAAAAGPAPAVSGPSRRPRPERKPARILVVEDDPQTLRHVRDTLTEAGYAVVATGDPKELPGLVTTHGPELILLDLVLPGTDGIALMTEVRELDDVPVVFISAYGRDETVVRALDAGADDYIAKPFSPSELVARVRAVLRRKSEPEAFLLSELEIRYDERRVTVAGQPVELTVTEFEVLRLLSVNAGRPVRYETFLSRAWGARYRGTHDPKLVHALVKSLRRKLGDDAANPVYVRNQRGVGYRMPAPEEESPDGA